MKTRMILQFRLTALLMTGALVAFGCSSNNTPSDTGTGGTGDGGVGDEAVGTDDVVDESRSDVTTGDGDDTRTDEGVSDTVTDTDAATETSDTGGGDTDADNDADVAKPDVQVPPICKEAKNNCKNCALCPGQQPICTLKEIGGTEYKTYPGDCAAMCALNAVKWPAEVTDKNGDLQVFPGECPACPSCTPTDMKTPSAYCATLNSGEKVTVAHQCELECLADAKKDTAGKVVASKGACKQACTDPPPNGGGCTFANEPVCAKEDNTTYGNICKMEHCDLKGCYSGTAETAQCTPGKMTKECDGACYDAVKDKSCPATCAPTCAIKKVTNGTTTTIQSKTFRSPCIAAENGYQTGSCDGVTQTSTDICSASLYVNTPCCPGVNYNQVNPFCGFKSQGSGKPDLYVTFISQAEFTCFKAADPTWLNVFNDPITNQPASGACICNCNGNVAPVCGADGFTYTNACQATCFNPDPSYTYTTGPCP